MSSKELYTSPEYEEAPRLSFCDLESAHWDVNSSSSSNNNNKCNSSCSNEEDEGLVFEFFSSRSGFSFTAPENIIFCGKQMTTLETSSKKKNNLKKKVLSWMMPSSSSSSSSSPSKQRNKCSKKKRSWWMVMFGSVRVPKEMDLSDIKTRQKHRPPEAVKAFVAMFDDHQQQTNKLAMETKTSSSISGLIGTVRSFSCKV